MKFFYFLTILPEAWANNDASGLALLVLPTFIDWWFFKELVLVGDCILRNPVGPFKSVALWVTGNERSCEIDVDVDITGSCWGVTLFRLLDLFVEEIVTDWWVEGWGVIDLCCFSICSKVCAAGWDIKRASKGLLSTATALPWVGGSPALKCPVFTYM